MFFYDVNINPEMCPAETLSCQYKKADLGYDLNLLTSRMSYLLLTVLADYAEAMATQYTNGIPQSS